MEEDRASLGIKDFQNICVHVCACVHVVGVVAEVATN